MKISKKEFTKLIQEELKNTVKEHKKEEQALREIIAEELALAQEEEVLQEEALIMEAQLQILTELRDEGVITEEQLQEIFRALGKAASAMKGRVKGAAGAAGAALRGVRAKAAGALAGGGSYGAAGAAMDAEDAFGSAKQIYSMTKKLSVLQDHRTKLANAMEDIGEIFKKIGMEAPAAANSVKQRFGQMVRNVSIGIKQLDQGLEELTTAVEAAKNPAGAKQLPAGAPVPA